MASLLLALAAAFAAWRVYRAPRDLAPGGTFVCAMHPAVSSPAPGRCPICGMALEPLRPLRELAMPSLRAFDLVRQRTFGQDLVATGWLDADAVVHAIVYKDEVAGLTSALTGSFTPAPGDSVAIRWADKTPTPWDRNTVEARFRAASTKLPAGTIGWIKMATRPRAQLVIASPALLEGADGPYVLVASADGRSLTRRFVEIGRVVNGVAFVVSGLRPKERVLVRDVFFYDVERRLAGAATAAP